MSSSFKITLIYIYKYCNKNIMCFKCEHRRCNDIGTFQLEWVPHKWRNDWTNECWYTLGLHTNTPNHKASFPRQPVARTSSVSLCARPAVISYRIVPSTPHISFSWVKVGPLSHIHQEGGFFIISYIPISYFKYWQLQSPDAPLYIYTPIISANLGRFIKWVIIEMSALL